MDFVCIIYIRLSTADMRQEQHALSVADKAYNYKIKIAVYVI